MDELLPRLCREEPMVFFDYICNIKEYMNLLIMVQEGKWKRSIRNFQIIRNLHKIYRLIESIGIDHAANFLGETVDVEDPNNMEIAQKHICLVIQNIMGAASSVANYVHGMEDEKKPQVIDLSYDSTMSQYSSKQDKQETQEKLDSFTVDSFCEDMMKKSDLFLKELRTIKDSDSLKNKTQTRRRRKHLHKQQQTRKHDIDHHLDDAFSRIQLI